MRKPTVILWLLPLFGGLDDLTPSASAANWPRFRGPNGAGVALDKDIPVQWSDKSGVLWKAPVPGRGNGSPVIWGDRIFIQTALEKERLLLCLNAADGKEIWSQKVPGKSGRTHKKNTLASSTPATDGERVYALLWDGSNLVLHAFDFSGKLVWKKDLGSFASEHGPGLSPIVFDGKVILNFDQDRFNDKFNDKENPGNLPGRPSALYALDAATGKEIWKTVRQGHRTCYSTPFVLEGQGEPELIVATTLGITAYNPGTGAEKWNWSWKFPKDPLRTVASPIFSQGMIFAQSGAGNGDRFTVAVKKGDKGDVTQTNLAWSAKKTVPYVPTMLAWGDHLYFVNDQGIAGCIVAKTGATVWSERLGGAMSGSPILIDGKIYAADETGDVGVFRAAPKFELLAKSSLGEGVIATPAVADGRLFIRGKNHLFCIGK